MPSWAKWLLRLAVSAALLALLLSSVSPQQLVPAIRAVPAATWMTALGIFLGCHAIAAAKWRLLLGRERVPLGLAIRTHFMGLAANLFLPGLAGGDVVRAGVLGRMSGDWGTVAVAGIVDRLIDTAALVLLASIGAIWSARQGELALQVILASVLLLLLAGGAGFIGIRWLGRGERNWQRQLAAATERLVARPGLTVRAGLISVLVQGLFVVVAAMLGRAVGLQADAATWLVVWTLAKLVAVLPVSLAGIGLREVALVALFAQYGVDEVPALATGLTWESVLVTGALVGGGLAWFAQRQIGAEKAAADV